VPRAQYITPEALARLGVDVLVSVLVEHAGADPILRKKLRRDSFHGTGEAHSHDRQIAFLRRLGKAQGPGAGTRSSACDDCRDLAPEEKQTAADLMWQFLGIADSVFERTDDSGGRVDEVFGHAK
jgi:hypothetical protein